MGRRGIEVSGGKGKGDSLLKNVSLLMILRRSHNSHPIGITSTS